MTRLWQTLTGRETHCTGCGRTLPGTLDNKFEEFYCSDPCRRNLRRLSSVPPPPPEEAISELRSIPFGTI
jgi:hypothetical protein